MAAECGDPVAKSATRRTPQRRPISPRRPRRSPGRSSLPLEVAGAAHQSDALIHDNLAHPQVVVDPLLDLGVLAEVVGADPRAAESISRVFQGACLRAPCQGWRLRGEATVASPGDEMGVVVVLRRSFMART